MEFVPRRLLAMSVTTSMSYPLDNCGSSEPLYQRGHNKPINYFNYGMRHHNILEQVEYNERQKERHENMVMNCSITMQWVEFVSCRLHTMSVILCISPLLGYCHHREGTSTSESRHRLSTRENDNKVGKGKLGGKGTKRLTTRETWSLFHAVLHTTSGI